MWDDEELPYHAHQKRVGLLMQGMCRVLNVTAPALLLPSITPITAYYAGAYHDIGKLFVPSDILAKAGPLTDAEWQIMRMHPVYAQQILQSQAFADYAAHHCPGIDIGLAIDAALYHHERVDGQGYPQCCDGSHIPAIAKLCAIADAYDAITSSRPYQERRSAQAAIDILRVGAGAQFDARFVSSLLNNMSWLCPRTK